MEGQDSGEGVDISITDEVNSDLDLIADAYQGTGDGFIAQDNG